MLQTAMSKSTTLSDEEHAAAAVSSGRKAVDSSSLISLLTPISPQDDQQQQEEEGKGKKKRNQPGNPDPEAEVVALSPRTLMATNRYVCEVCGKGFQREQNLQLHRRGHNLPWKLQRRKEGTGSGGGGGEKEEAARRRRKRVYVCPEPSCVHSHPSRALGDLTGAKKHYCRKHGEKVWSCARCGRRYAVAADWKAHAKACGSREYRCGCGSLFSRKDSFVTHRAFCDALAAETARLSAAADPPPMQNQRFQFPWVDAAQNPDPEAEGQAAIFPDDAAEQRLSATDLLRQASATTHVAGAGRGPLQWQGGEEMVLMSGLALDSTAPSPYWRGPAAATRPTTAPTSSSADGMSEMLMSSRSVGFPPPQLWRNW